MSGSFSRASDATTRWLAIAACACAAAPLILWTAMLVPSFSEVFRTMPLQAISTVFMMIPLFIFCGAILGFIAATRADRFALYIGVVSVFAVLSLIMRDLLATGMLVVLAIAAAVLNRQRHMNPDDPKEPQANRAFVLVVGGIIGIIVGIGAIALVIAIALRLLR